jgi:hypothetical protein
MESEIKAGDRVEYVRPRYGDPPPCYGTVDGVSPHAPNPYYVIWDEGTKPYGSGPSGGYYRRSEIALVVPTVPKGY